MSSADTQRAQIMFHLYTKLFNVICDARNTVPPSGAKLDKWFNMEVPDSDLFTKDHREPYRALGAAVPPPLEIQVLLAVPELAHNQVLVHLPPHSSRVRIQPVPRFVLLETFVLAVAAAPPADVPLATVYKHCILLFRSLYTLLRVLPAWKLHRRLRRRPASLGITLRVRAGPAADVLSLTNTESRTYAFPALPHPLGSFTVSAAYLAHPTFQLDELESVLSSRFLSQDQRPFTPTLARASAASSSSASPSRSSPAVALRTGAAHVLRQPDSSTSSLSPSNSFYTPPPPAHDAPPRPRYPFPFKSNTVSSSPGRHERVTSLSHTPDLAASRTGPIPLHVRQTSKDDPSVSTSASASPGTRKRYSSSFGHRYATPPSPTSTSASSRPAPIHTHARPSSSSSSPSSSSAPSVPRPIPRRPTRSSMGNRVRTDDEDISAFVHDIDMRKPLVGRSIPPGDSVNAANRAHSQLPQQPKRTTGFDSSPLFPGPASASSAEPLQHTSQSPPGGQVLTTEAEIDARLSKMNEAFLRSLRGLGSGSEGGTGSASGPSGSARRRVRSVSAMMGGREGDDERRRDDGDDDERRCDAWAAQPPGMLVRQGSQEVVGRMDIFAGGVDVDDLDPTTTVRGPGRAARFGF